MKILKDNYNEYNPSMHIDPYPRTIKCDMCGSELEFEREDIHMGVYGCMHITCPLCGEEIMLEYHEENIKLTKDNLEFPTHFYRMGQSYGAVNTCDNEHIKEWIDRGIDYLRNSDSDEWVYYTGSGNTHITIFKNDGDEEYYVCVCPDYYHTNIPFEKVDYK